MEYIDLKKLYKEEIALYCRVSSAGQNISQQISLAEIYIAQNNINTEKVQYFLDDNVSANKLTSEQRPQFQKLITEIKKGKIKTVFVLNRDRLARNFYEYVDLVKILYKFGVIVIFTDSSQPPFSKVLSVEALYGIFPQSEGRNISRRTNLAAIQYPKSIFGYNVVGERNTKKYTPEPSLENNIKSLFNSVMNTNSSDEVIEIFIKYKRMFTNHQKLFNCLKNPFYTGHIKVQDQYVKLYYVEPIILLEDYLKVQDSLLKFECELQTAFAISSNTGLLSPICSICKATMSFRSTKLGESGYYVCAKKHPRIQLEVAQYNQYISDHLTYVLDKIDVKEIKNDIFKYLLAQEKIYKQQLSYQQNQLQSLHKEMTDLIETNKKMKLDLLAKESKTIKEEMKQLHTKLIKIDEARNGINTFVNIIKERLTNELKNYQLEYLINLLFSKIEVSSDAIIYHTTFGKYIEGNDELYEYRA